MSIFEYDEEKHMRMEREEHFREGRSETLLLLLEEFNPLPEEVVDRIKNTTDDDTLCKWVKNAKKAASLNEFVEQM